MGCEADSKGVVEGVVSKRVEASSRAAGWGQWEVTVMSSTSSLAERPKGASENQRAAAKPRCLFAWREFLEFRFRLLEFKKRKESPSLFSPLSIAARLYFTQIPCRDLPASGLKTEE